MPQGASVSVVNIAVCMLGLFGNSNIFHIDFDIDFENIRAHFG